MIDNNETYNKIWSKNKDVDPSIHVMNKNERKSLRKLKAKYKIKDEQEIRMVKKNRVILSTEQKKTGDKSQFKRYVLKILKRVTKKLKLPKEHPLVINEFKKEIQEYRNSVFGIFNFEFNRMNDNTLLYMVGIKK